MAEIKLDDAQLNKALEGAVLAAIGDVGREAIIAKAVDFLVAPTSSGYYDKKLSPLMTIVAQAAERSAQTILKAKFESDPTFVAEVERLYADAFKRMFGAETREKIVENLAEAMGRALTKDRY